MPKRKTGVHHVPLRLQMQEHLHPCLNVGGTGRSEFADTAGKEKKLVHNDRILISTSHAKQHLMKRQMGIHDKIERTMAALKK
jgi:hypothetical protein